MDQFIDRFTEMVRPYAPAISDISQAMMLGIFALSFAGPFAYIFAFAWIASLPSQYILAVVLPLVGMFFYAYCAYWTAESIIATSS